MTGMPKGQTVLVLGQGDGIAPCCNDHLPGRRSAP
jgi:hypothetical protein